MSTGRTPHPAGEPDASGGKKTVHKAVSSAQETRIGEKERGKWIIKKKLENDRKNGTGAEFESN